MRKWLGALLILSTPAWSEESNWGGYVMRWDGSTIITQVSGCMRVPEVRPGQDTGGINTVSQWIGIGGYYPNQTLAQLGVGNEIDPSGAITRYAYYAFGMGNQGVLSRVAYPVEAGDTVCPSARCTTNCVADGGDEGWDMAIIGYKPDASVKWSWSEHFDGRRSDLKSAEWIIEAPARPPCCKLLYPVPDFEPILFTKAVYNEAPADLRKAGRARLSTSTARGYPRLLAVDSFVVCGARADPVPRCGPPAAPDASENSK